MPVDDLRRGQRRIAYDDLAGATDVARRATRCAHDPDAALLHEWSLKPESAIGDALAIRAPRRLVSRVERGDDARGTGDEIDHHKRATDDIDGIVQHDPATIR